MTSPYRTVVTGPALEVLTRLFDREKAAGRVAAMASALDAIQRALASDPHGAGAVVSPQRTDLPVRTVVVPPLLIEYTVNEARKAVFVLAAGIVRK